MKTTASTDQASRRSAGNPRHHRRGRGLVRYAVQTSTAGGPKLGEQRADDDQHRQRGADHQRLGVRVVAAGRQRREVEEDAGGEAQRHREIAAARPPPGAGEQREDGDRAGETGEVGAAGRFEAIVRRRPDAERLDRRDRPVGVGAGDFAEAAAEAEGADRGRRQAERRKDDDRQQRRRPEEEAQQRPRRQCPPYGGHREAPEDDDEHRPGEAGEAVGEEDPARDRQPGQELEQAPPGRLEVAQADGDGEDEERLGELLEGALGEVGGGEVGDGDQRRRQRPPARAEARQRPEGGEAGEDADREDLADEGLAEADSRHRGGRHGEPVRPERVAGVGCRPEAAAQPLGPGEVQAEVVVQPDPQQPPAPADRERDREHQRHRDRHRHPPAPGLPPPMGRKVHSDSTFWPIGSWATREGEDHGGGDEEQDDADGRGRSVAGGAGEHARDGEDRAEARGRLQPRPAGPPGEQQQGAADEQ